MKKLITIILAIIMLFAISAKAVTLLQVPQGGTGAGTFTAGDILQGNGTGAIQGNTMSGDATLAVGGALTIGADKVHDSMIDWGTGANQVSSSDMPDHNGHTVRDSFVHIVNRGVADAITVSLTGGLGVSWTTGEIYDRANHTFVATDAGSGNVTNTAVNYLKWVSGTTLTLSTSDATGDEVLIAIGTIYDGNIDGYRETSLLDESLANIRRCSRAVFPTRVTSGMSVYEDADVTNPLDVTMDAGVYCKELQERITPVEIKSRNTAMVRHFHTGGVWDSDTNAQIETTNYDNGTQKTAIPANKYVKGLFIFMNGKIGFVYPTEYFNTIAQAQAGALPVMPTGLEPIPKLTAVVYQQGAVNFTGAVWQDVRAGISEESFSGVTDHGALSGLGDDDHPQYGALADAETITGNWINTANPWADNEVSNALTVTGYMQDTDIDTFAELQSWAVGYTDNDTTYVSSDFTHDDLTGFVANEHLDWTGDLGAVNIHAGNYTDTNTTYVSSDFTHDDLTGFVANEHLDWTTDLGATNIHSGNYTAGLTNLTDFDQTAWRLFYSNNLGDVIELSLGTNGEYLQSQGGTSSLTWSTPTDTTANETITLSGDITGSGETAITTTIGANKVLESHLKAVDAPADEECLTYEVTTGDFEWQTCSAGAGDVTAVFDCADGDCNTMTVGTSEYLTYGTGYIDANRFAGVTTVDATEFGYLNGVTSAIQTQFGGKQSTLTNSAGLLAALNDETGTGLSVFSTSPTFTTGITVPNDSISAAELNEGDAFAWTSTHDFGGATSLEIPNGAAPTVNAIGEIALDTTSDQLVYYGSAKRVLQEEDTKCFTIESLAAADDNMEIFMANDAITITAIGLHCAGTCTTGADISLEDRAGNAMTHTTPTHSTGSGNTTFQAVTNNNTLVSGEGLRFDVDNAVSPETDTYLICFKMKYTSD